MIYDCVNLSPSEQIGMHSQPDWELSYILQGHGRRQIGAAESPFSEGDMVLVVPECRTAGDSRNPPEAESGTSP